MNPDQTPLLSVVMPVHNAAPFLDESICGIVNQTFSDFEFVILDDGSTDGSWQKLLAWQERDDRIRLFRSDRQLGLAGSSNLVVSQATAPIIARMDGDDISERERLSRQWEIIERCPDVVVVGTLCDGIDARGCRMRPRDRWRLVRRSRYIPFPHGSAMFRRAAFDAVGGYDEEFVAGEDQHFFFKMSTQGRVVTLPDVLYHFRYHLTNTTILTRACAIETINGNHPSNGEHLASLYLVGAMRLWAGYPPETLPAITANGNLDWNARSLLALATASLGNMSPATLRFFLRLLIHARDRLASLQVKDGRPYEWRLK